MKASIFVLVSLLLFSILAAFIQFVALYSIPLAWLSNIPALIVWTYWFDYGWKKCEGGNV